MKKSVVILILLMLGGCASRPLHLNEPVFLKVGETKQVGPDGFEIMLRSVSEDSGCLSPTDCSTMIFQGSIVVRMGDRSKVIETRAIMKPGQVVPLDLDGYEFRLTGVQRGAQNRIQAIFIVLGPKKP
jgi:hypothetical protein